MKLLAVPLLADENLQPGVIAALKAQGRDIVAVRELGLIGARDLVILRHAHARGRVVVRHDANFGASVVRAGEPTAGIIVIRPGHVDEEVTLRTLAAVESFEADIAAPFIIVAERRGDTVRIRVRRIV
jgi:predicted nuclease of predicted toxin-antitoxin system